MVREYASGIINFHISFRDSIANLEGLSESLTKKFSNYLEIEVSNQDFFPIDSVLSFPKNLIVEENLYKYFDFKNFNKFQNFGMFLNLKHIYHIEGLNTSEVSAGLKINVFGWDKKQLNSFCCEIKNMGKDLDSILLKPLL